MAKTSIYLPDDLAEQVRAHGIPVSEVAQTALRQAVRDIKLKEDAMTDMQAVAERLLDTRRKATEESQAEDQRVHGMGVKWARVRATAADLEYVATFDGKADDFHAPESLIYTVIERGWAKMPHHPGNDRWAHFQAGTREVWEAVQPLLAAQHDESL